MANNFAFNTKGSTASKVFNAVTSPFGVVPGLLSNILRSKASQPKVESKYGSNAPVGTIGGADYAKPSTPVKSVTDTQGNKIEYHSPAKEGVLKDTKKTEAPLNSYNPPTGIRPPEIASSQSESITPSSAARSVYSYGEISPEERDAISEVRRANELQKAYQNVSQFSPYAESSLYADRARTPAEVENIIKAPDLIGRAESTTGLLGGLGNLYGSSRVAGAQAGLDAIQTQRQRGLLGAQSVLSSSLPGQISPPASLYSPLGGQTGEYNPLSGITRGATYNAFNEASQKYNQLQPTFQAIQGIEGQLQNLLGTSDINSSNLNKVNDVVNFIRRNTSDPRYAQFNVFLSSLNSLYSQYLARNGYTTDMVREATQGLIPENANANTIKAALDALKIEATTVQKAYYDQINKLGESFSQGTVPTPNTSETSGGSFGWEALNK